MTLNKDIGEQAVKAAKKIFEGWDEETKVHARGLLAFINRIAKKGLEELGLPEQAKKEFLPMAVGIVVRDFSAALSETLMEMSGEINGEVEAAIKEFEGDVVRGESEVVDGGA